MGGGAARAGRLSRPAPAGRRCINFGRAFYAPKFASPPRPPLFPAQKGERARLLKIIAARLKQLHIVTARHILHYIASGPLSMPHLPITRPSGEIIPSMAMTEPLRLLFPEPETIPSGEQYWVAIWPLSIRALSCSWSAQKRPSPCETGTAYISPGWQRESQGNYCPPLLYALRLKYACPA